MLHWLGVIFVLVRRDSVSNPSARVKWRNPSSTVPLCSEQLDICSFLRISLHRQPLWPASFISSLISFFVSYDVTYLVLCFMVGTVYLVWCVLWHYLHCRSIHCDILWLELSWCEVGVTWCHCAPVKQSDACSWPRYAPSLSDCFNIKKFILKCFLLYQLILYIDIYYVMVDKKNKAHILYCMHVLHVIYRKLHKCIEVALQAHRKPFQPKVRPQVFVAGLVCYLWK